MDFRRVAIIAIISVICAGAIGILLAISGFGVWSLIWQSLALSLLTVILTWFMSPWRPSLQFHFSAIKDVMGFSMNLLGSNILNFLSRNFDDLLIGRFIGSSALGIYTKAYQLMLLPLTQVSWVVARVMFPSLSSIQHDVVRVKKVYLSILRAIALVTFPLMIGMFVVSKPFVLVVFGSKWSGMIPILRIFCLAGVVDSITTTVGWIYHSQGRTDIEFKFGVICAVITIGAFIIGLNWGIMGMAVAYVLTAYLILWPAWTVAGRLINLRFSEMLKNVLSSFYCSATMGIVVWVIGLILPFGWTDWKCLTVQLLCGVGFYWGLIHIFRLKAYMEIMEIIFKLFYRIRFQ
jgi:PST family polysaccharide transporter